MVTVADEENLGNKEIKRRQKQIEMTFKFEQFTCCMQLRKNDIQDEIIQ